MNIIPNVFVTDIFLTSKSLIYHTLSQTHTFFLLKVMRKTVDEIALRVEEERKGLYSVLAMTSVLATVSLLSSRAHHF